MSRVRRLALAAGLAVLPAIIVGARAGAQDAERLQGRMLYEVHCASCHGSTAGGSQRAPTLLGVGPAALDFMMSTGRMPLDAAGQRPTRSAPRLSPEEIDAITAYVVSLKPGGPQIPGVRPERGDLARGRAIYGLNCLACHGPGGQGGAIGGGAVAPPLHPATPTQIGEAVRFGPGAMPGFGETVIDDEDLDSLIRYARSLRTMDDPGGADLGTVGPVAEGFIAWVIGLGALLVVLRLAGGKS